MDAFIKQHKFEELVKAFKIKRVIFLTDVDGLFTSNPILDPKAELVQTLTEDSFSSACTSENVNPDVTGGIFLKAKIALSIAKLGVESYIINGTVKGRLAGALRADEVLGTIVKPEI